LRRLVLLSDKIQENSGKFRLGAKIDLNGKNGEMLPYFGH
jgi:hypothetical protein